MMTLGFVNGVLNTDNTSVFGLSIDYGPFGFMEAFDPMYTPFLQDHHGAKNYSWQNQVNVGAQNCAQLAQSLVSAGLLDAETAQASVNQYGDIAGNVTEYLFRRKLGLSRHDEHLVHQLLELMHDSDADFTLTFRLLMDFTPNVSAEDFLSETMRPAFALRSLTEDEERRWSEWLTSYASAIEKWGMPDRREVMKKTNPRIIPRQHLLLEATQAAERHDYHPAHSLYEACLDPFSEGELDHYATPADPDLSRAKGVAFLTCST